MIPKRMRPFFDRSKRRWSDDLLICGDSWSGRIALGNATEFTMVMVFPGDGTFICGIVDHGCYIFPLHSFLQGSYVDKKLNLGSEADGKNLADFFNTFLRGEFPEQGEYNERYCQD